MDLNDENISHYALNAFYKIFAPWNSSRIQREKSRENTIKVKQIEFMERAHGMRKQKLDDWDEYELES